MPTLMIELEVPDAKFSNEFYHFLQDSIRFCCRLHHFDPPIQTHFKSFVELTTSEIDEIIKEALK